MRSRKMIVTARFVALAGLFTGACAARVVAAPFDAKQFDMHNASCSITAAPFSLTYDPFALTATERVASVTVRCRSRGPLHLVVEAGPGLSGSTARRLMSERTSGARLSYTLSLNGAPFGDGTGGTRSFVRDYTTTDGIVTESFLVTLYAPAGQDVPVGAYGDTIALVARY